LKKYHGIEYVEGFSARKIVEDMASLDKICAYT